ncbi:MAG: hypothetical protein ABI629_10440 [bacterium]
MTNPLRHYDQFNVGHVEPSVTSFIETEATEPTRADPVNVCVVLSPFRSGKPLELRNHRSDASIENLHDPYRNGDQGVAMAKTARDSFSDRSVFGAADITTIRVDPSQNALLYITDGVNNLFKIERTDYGSHTNGPGAKFGAASSVGKKLELTDTMRTFIGDNLGILLTGLQYVGNGSAATLTILYGIGKIAYSGQPADGDALTVNGVTFEFDNNAAVTGGRTAVTIGVSADATFAALAAAISTNVPNVHASADATTDIVTLTALEQGVAMVEVTDTGGVMVLTHLPPAARLKTTLTAATDGSANLDIALTLSQFRSIAQLAGYINSQFGYTCAVSPFADKFIESTGLDVVSGVNIRTSAVFLTGYVAAAVNWVNTKASGYTATEIARDEPVDQNVIFAGGATRPVTAADWQNALDAVGAGLEVGGILLPDTDDPAIFAMVATFIEEQRTMHGKWFRAFFGAQPALIPDGSDISRYDAIASAVDSERCRIYVQRFAQFRADNRTIDYLHPVFFAAAMAGGAAGNLPFVQPLTNKRLRFPGLHPDDVFTEETRSALIESGITVAKTEQDRLVVALAVAASRSDKRMDRIMAEIDTVDLIDNAVRQAFLPFRGRWADQYIAGRVKGTLTKVLQQFVDQGALVSGKNVSGEAVPAWRFATDPPFTIQAGSVDLEYQIFIGSEIDHIDLHGRASYQRLVGEAGSSLIDRKVTVPR